MLTNKISSKLTRRGDTAVVQEVEVVYPSAVFPLTSAADTY